MLVTGTLVLVNSNEGISNKLSDIPVVGNIAKVMTVNDFNKKDIITQDNNILNTTENKTEEAVENTPQTSEVTVKTTQDNNKTKITTPKSNKTPEKKAETNIPKTESYNDKTEPEKIMEIPNTANETVGNNEYSLSVARSVDFHNEQGVEIELGDVQDEGVLETEESSQLYEKLSDLYDSEYDYRKEISEKIQIR